MPRFTKLFILLFIWGLTHLAHGQDGCVSGCNENAFIFSSDPNTMEYDNMISGYHSTMVKEANNVYKTWGAVTAPINDGNADNDSPHSNHLLSPTEITPANGYNYDGDILKFTIGSVGRIEQHLILTTQGFYAWGTAEGIFVPSITNQTNFHKVMGIKDANSYGLPDSVTPEEVKMLFGSHKTLGIVTCDGLAYVLSSGGKKNGDGTNDNGTNPRKWHAVHYSNNTSGDTNDGLLTNVVAMRGTAYAMIALTSDNKVYTWGDNTYLGDGSATTHRTYATEMSLPTELVGNVKMIGMTIYAKEKDYLGPGSEKGNSYYLLGTDGKLYSLGKNSSKQLGDGTTNEATTWVRPRYSSNNFAGEDGETYQPGSTMDDILYINPQEHDGSYPIVNAINSQHELISWGGNPGRAIGGFDKYLTYHPITQGRNLNDRDVIAVTTSGHTTMAILDCETKYAYVGHYVNGSQGAGNQGANGGYGGSYYTDGFDFEQTSTINLCGAPTAPIVNNILLCNSGFANLDNALNDPKYQPEDIEWWTTADKQPGTEVQNPNQVEVGQYYAFIANLFDCPQPLHSSVRVYSCIEGNVLQDTDGPHDINGTPTIGLDLYINLINENGNVVASTEVAGDGSFSLPTNVVTFGNTYTLQLTEEEGAIGNPEPNTTLPHTWYIVGESFVSTGNDGTPDGKIQFTVGEDNTHAVRFGINQLDACDMGCNENTYLNATNPNTIEYDNMVGLYHSTIIKESHGVFKIWGARSAPNGSSSRNTPIEITSANGYNYTGTPLRATGGAANSTNVEYVLLTTDGLYFWGKRGLLIDEDVAGSSTAFKKGNAIGTVGETGTNAKTLPMGVEPEHVKMLFGTYQTLALVTCTGEAYVLTMTDNMFGNGIKEGTSTEKNQWHRVHTDANTPLKNVVAVRGTNTALMALTASGEVYTWGSDIYLGDGLARHNEKYATKMDLSGLTGHVKMIGMTGKNTYYILADNGRLYGLGRNGARQLGNFTTTDSQNWVRVQKSTTEYLDDVAWISPNEHSIKGNDGSGYPYEAINIITTDGKKWSWGYNSSKMLGGSVSRMDPTYMTGTGPGDDDLKEDDTLMAVETGGHTTLVIRNCTRKYGYIGHKTSGSMGDGVTSGGQIDIFNFTDTGEINLCGAPTQPAIQHVAICNTATGNLWDALIDPYLDPQNASWWTSNDQQPGTEVADPTQVGVGEYYVFGPNPFNCDINPNSRVYVYSCIEGIVVRDSDGPDDINGKPTNGRGLYVNLINEDNEVVASVEVEDDGSFVIPANAMSPGKDYTLQLTKNEGIIGNSAPSTTLHKGWSTVGESFALTGNDGTPDGELHFIPGTEDTRTVRFGIRMAIAVTNPMLLNSAYKKKQ